PLNSFRTGFGKRRVRQAHALARLLTHYPGLGQLPLPPLSQSPFVWNLPSGKTNRLPSGVDHVTAWARAASPALGHVATAGVTTVINSKTTASVTMSDFPNILVSSFL